MTQSWKGSTLCDFDATEDFVGNTFLAAGTFIASSLNCILIFLYYFLHYFSQVRSPLRNSLPQNC